MEQIDKHRERRNELQRERRKRNPEKYKKQEKTYNEKNREKRRFKTAEWRKNNPERSKQSQLKTREKYKDRYNSKTREWREKNKIKTVEYSIRRSLAEALRTPKWLNEQQLNDIVDVYKKAKEVSISTGLHMQVDHIIPLRGNNVSGLHVPWNLQIIEGKLNGKKSNNF
jgi:hypothetical protein